MNKLLMLLLCPLLLAAQTVDLAAKFARIQIGKASLDDVIGVFGEPEELYSGQEPLTRANLPANYTAKYPLFSVIVERGRVGAIQIETRDFQAHGVRLGSSVADVLREIGAPGGVVKGPSPEIEPRPGVLYEGGGPEAPGGTRRLDLGLVLEFRAGKVSGMWLVRQIDGKLKALPRYDPNSQDIYQMDFRGADLSLLDLRGRAADLFEADFDTKTIWPEPERMPEAFDRARILATGRNPGLGVRALHQRGITGKGVSIAFIDNPLQRSHNEYQARLRFSEYLNARPGETHFHGTTAVSIATGATTGVAPAAEIYYVSSWGTGPDVLSYRAKAVRRLLELNRNLPPGKRLRVISMSDGWTDGQPGAVEMRAAVNEAKAAGIFFVSASSQETYGFSFFGLDRQPLADPDRFDSYRPGRLWARDYYAGAPYLVGSFLWIPIDSRTAASDAGPEDYAFWRTGGISWAIPYIAGVYALAVQVDPAITPERFWAAAMRTGRVIELAHEGKSYKLGPIIDPPALIAALEKARSERQ